MTNKVDGETATCWCGQRGGIVDRPRWPMDPHPYVIRHENGGEHLSTVVQDPQTKAFRFVDANG